MLKKHKNRIFEQIKTDGFNPNDFEFINVKDNLDRILVNDSKLWFGFEMQPESFEHFRYSYSFFTPQTNATGSAKTDSFESILKTFRTSLDDGSSLILG